ncbi:MAG: hypothetical protein M9939_26725 [Mesorhizobium sp.]|nr:hypothetical protein [Mesorhizobium sp.]MCO5164689.1 hypothetical protein [Mesorhizobium sp.]
MIIEVFEGGDGPIVHETSELALRRGSVGGSVGALLSLEETLILQPLDGLVFGVAAKGGEQVENAAARLILMIRPNVLLAIDGDAAVLPPSPFAPGRRQSLVRLAKELGQYLERNRLNADVKIVAHAEAEAS